MDRTKCLLSCVYSCCVWDGSVAYCNHVHCHIWSERHGDRGNVEPLAVGEQREDDPRNHTHNVEHRFDANRHGHHPQQQQQQGVRKAPPPSIARVELPFKLPHNRLVALGQWTLDGRPLLSSPFCLLLPPPPEASFLPSHTDTHTLSSVPCPSVGPPSLTSSRPWSLEDPEARPAARIDALRTVYPPRSFLWHIHSVSA